MKLLAGAIALGTIALTGSAFVAAGRPPAPAPTTVRSSRLVSSGRIRCSVSIRTPVTVGHGIRALFRYHNISTHAIRVDFQNDGPWLVIRGSDGKTYDTRIALEDIGGGPVPPTRIAPGGSVWQSLSGLSVRWRGPLRITPGCGEKRDPEGSGLQLDGGALPTLHVRVARATAPASERVAVADVVAASGHLLDNCRPRVPGLAVQGVLKAPDASAPPMHARCSVSVAREGGFDLAQELIVTPARLAVHLREPYGQLIWPRTHGDWEAVAWEFAVTRNRAVPVAEDDIFGIKPGEHREAPDWQWTRSGSRAGSGGANCRFMTGGSSGDSWGGYRDGPDVVWVTACRAAR